MINTKVIASFVMCILFNVLLNSFDHYSDVTLAYESMNFDLGDSLLLSGCRVCHGKSDSDIYDVKETKCQKCLLENYDFQSEGKNKYLRRFVSDPVRRSSKKIVWRSGSNLGGETGRRREAKRADPLEAFCVVRGHVSGESSGLR